MSELDSKLDEVLSGFLDDINDALEENATQSRLTAVSSVITDTSKEIKALILSIVEDLRGEAITVLPETFPTGARRSIVAVPVSEIDKAKERLGLE